jgi:hypothetical protein
LRVGIGGGLSEGVRVAVVVVGVVGAVAGGSGCSVGGDGLLYEGIIVVVVAVVVVVVAVVAGGGGGRCRGRWFIRRRGIRNAFFWLGLLARTELVAVDADGQ